MASDLSWKYHVPSDSTVTNGLTNIVSINVDFDTWLEIHVIYLKIWYVKVEKHTWFLLM